MRLFADRYKEAAVVFASAVILGLTACNSGAGTVTEGETVQMNSEQDEGESSEEEMQKVTIWMGSWWEDQIPTIVEAYKEVKPNVELIIEALPVNGYVDKAVTTILGGGGPDILAVDVTQMGTLVDKNLLAPWDDQIQDMDLSDFASVIEGCRFDNVYYGLPYRTSASIMLYNKTMFDAAGVPYPEEGWTYEDMLEIARQLTIPGEQYGLGIAVSNSDPSNVFTCLTPIVWAFGGDFLNEDQTVCVLNTPEAIEAIRFFSELYTVEKVVPEGSLNYKMLLLKVQSD